MERPTYVIVNEEIHLAEPTPKRIEAFLKFYGKTKLSELFLPAKEGVEAASREFGILALDATGDSQSAAMILSACLEREISPEVAANVPVTTIAQVNLDFFLLLILTFYGRVR
ncbi:MAG: hypothetical protein AB1728_13250 [Bacteroidota bacterium]